MSKAGEKLLKGLEEALVIARCEIGNLQCIVELQRQEIEGLRAKLNYADTTGSIPPEVPSANDP